MTKKKATEVLIYSDNMEEMFGTEQDMLNNYNEMLACNDEEPITEFTDAVEEYHRDLAQTYLDDFLGEFGDIPVIAIASLGLWAGRRDGGKSGKLKDLLLLACEDDNYLYYDREDGTFKLNAHHHDGTNYFTFYQLTKKGQAYLDKHGDTREAHHHVDTTKGYTKRIKY